MSRPRYEVERQVDEMPDLNEEEDPINENLKKLPSEIKNKIRVDVIEHIQLERRLRDAERELRQLQHPYAHMRNGGLNYEQNLADARNIVNGIRMEIKQNREKGLINYV
jgi:predicted  nucleic acid-binding Zn-ribbon protein